MVTLALTQRHNMVANAFPEGLSLQKFNGWSKTRFIYTAVARKVVQKKVHKCTRQDRRVLCEVVKFKLSLTPAFQSNVRKCHDTL